MPDRVKGAVFLPVGLALLVAAGFMASATREFLAGSLVAPGVVVAERYGQHHVDVRFRTRAGEEITYGQNGLVTLHTGERVMVRYDPRSPRMDPSVDQWQALWDGTMSLGGLGSVFTVAGAAMRRRPKEAAIARA